MKQCEGASCDPIQSRRVIGHAPRGGTSFVPSIAREGTTTIVPLHLRRSSSNCSHSFAGYHRSFAFVGHSIGEPSRIGNHAVPVYGSVFLCHDAD
jgi:hypothetical protein